MGSHTGRDRARRWTLSGDGADARDRLTSGCNSTEGETPTMSLTAIAHHLMPFAALAGGILYRVPEIVTRGRFPDGGESDSTWRTQEARHVGSDTIAPGFWCATGSRFGKEDQRRASGSPAFSTRGYLRWGNAHRGGQDRRCRTSDHPGLGVALQRPRS